MLEAPSWDETISDPKLGLCLIFSDKNWPALGNNGSTTPFKITMIHSSHCENVCIQQKKQKFFVFP